MTAATHPQQAELKALLTKIIREQQPTLGDFHVTISKRAFLRSRVSVELKKIIIPRDWGIEQILLEIGPTIKKAAMQIEYDAHEINDHIDKNFVEVQQRVKYLARYAPNTLHRLLSIETENLITGAIN